MVYSQFGLRQMNESTQIDDLLKTVSKIDSISAQLLLREAYEVSYQIFDHDADSTHPWALVMDHPKENYTEYGTLYRTIHGFHFRDIHKKFGLNLTEFLELPREIVELVIHIANKDIERKNRTFDEVKDNLEDEFDLN